MLADVVAHQPVQKREVLVRALRSPIFERAWQAGSGSLGGLAQWLTDEHGYAGDLCQWAVETWALTLGLPLTTPVSTRETTRATTKLRAAESDRGTRPTADSVAARKEAVSTPAVLLARLQDRTLSHQARLEIGQELARIGDPRPGVGLRADGLPDVVWISIPGGQVRVDLETPNSFIRFTEMGTFRSKLDVAPFRIAKYPVTNAQFEVFLTASDGDHNRGWMVEGYQLSP